MHPHPTPDDIALMVWSAFEQMQAEIAREIRVLLNEPSYDQKMFGPDDVKRRIEAMQKCAAFHTSDAERHESWREIHYASGWTYGPELDPANKKHPNLLPWDELPQNTRSKAKIFDICSKHASIIAGLVLLAKEPDA
jgi:hypothetical protein